MADRHLLEDAGEWQDTSGNRIQLCVVEELNKDSGVSAAAITTFGGFSLCRAHFEQVTAQIRAGIPMGQIVNDMMTKGLD